MGDEYRPARRWLSPEPRRRQPDGPRAGSEPHRFVDRSMTHVASIRSHHRRPHPPRGAPLRACTRRGPRTRHHRSAQGTRPPRQRQHRGDCPRQDRQPRRRASRSRPMPPSRHQPKAVPDRWSAVRRYDYRVLRTRQKVVGLAGSQLSSHSGHRSRGIESSDRYEFGYDPHVAVGTAPVVAMPAMTESLEKSGEPSAPASRSGSEPTSSGGRPSVRCVLAACLRTPPSWKGGPQAPPQAAMCSIGPGTTRLVSLSSLVISGCALPVPPAAHTIPRLRCRQLVLFATTREVGHSGATVLRTVIERWGR